MSRSTICWTILPAAAVAFYFVTRRLATPFFLRFVSSEQGLVELGTVAFFLVSSYLAARLAMAPTQSVPTLYRALYGLFAIAALFVGLEEISYGQHLFGWTSSEYFREHNSQGEVNLHNMLDNNPAKRMHMVANLGTAAGFVVLPVLLWLGKRYASSLPDALRQVSRSAYAPGMWTYYLVPGMELIVIAILARLVASSRKTPSGVNQNELRELLWAWAAFGYIVIVSRRLRPSAPRSPP